MELFFTDTNFKIGCRPFPGVPFFVDSQFGLVEEINDFFLEELATDGRTSSPKTWQNYAYWLLDYLRWLESAHINWRSATRIEVAAYRNWSLDDCGQKASTVNSRLSAIKRLYGFAEKKGWIDLNPIIEVASTRSQATDKGLLGHTHKKNGIRNDLSLTENRELPKIYSQDEIARLFNKSSNQRLKLMMLLMLECGLRRKEVVKLPASFMLTLENKAKTQGRNSEILVELPREICKGGKSREVSISYSTAMKLRQYRATVRPRLVKKYRKENKGQEPLRFWITKHGKALSIDTLTTEIARLGVAAAVNHANAHKFRHTFATELYAITGDIRLVQKLLGHSNIQTTTIYEHCAGSDRKGFLEDYQNKIDTLIGEIV